MPLQKCMRDFRKNGKRLIPRLVSDASNFGMGAPLEQWLDNAWRPSAFFSRKFSPVQQAYIFRFTVTLPVKHFVP